jgi:hypothetical protein
VCFSLVWLEQICIYIVVVIAIWSIIKLLIPFIGIPLVTQILEIVLWAVIAIMVIYIVFALISCLLGSGGLSLLPHGR